MDVNKFKLNVKEYMLIESKISELDKKKKILKERKDMLHESIFIFMKENEIKQVNLPNNQKIQSCVKKSRPGTNKKFIENRLTKYCEEKNLDFEDLYNFIYHPDYREPVEKESIKKITIKK